jgi:hypothetical protein
VFISGTTEKFNQLTFEQTIVYKKRPAIRQLALALFIDILKWAESSNISFCNWTLH